MRVGSGDNSYNWIDNWANIPESDSSRMGWAHPVSWSQSRETS